MKYFKTFEGFKKEYMTKIDLKDFKKIKKGTKLTYMGGPAEVMDNNGYVLTLKGEDDKTFTVNKSQFDHGGFIKESVNEAQFKVGDNVIVMRKDGKEYTGKVEKLNPLKLRISPSDTMVIPNAYIKDIVVNEAAGKPGMWANIHAKRKRGEAPAKPGDPDRPSEKEWKDNTNESSLTSEGTFFRLPKNVIGNELYLASKNLTNLFNRANAGNDIDTGAIDSIVRQLNTVKKSVKKFNSAEEIKGTVYESIIK